MRAIWRHARILAPLLLVSIALVSPALAAMTYDGVYEGTIGTASIVVEFTGGAGRYFYAWNGVDLALQITAHGDRLDIDERGVDEPKSLPSTGSWQGQLANDAFSGTWNDGKRTLPIALKRIGRETRSPTHEIDETEKPYEWLWAKSIVTYADDGREVVTGDLGYRMVKDHVFGLRYPRLTRFPDAARLAAANRALVGIHLASLVSMRNNINDVRQSAALRDGRPYNKVSERGSNGQDSLTVSASRPSR
jgi:hypothetical protein